jgi:hypothetical protein
MVSPKGTLLFYTVRVVVNESCSELRTTYVRVHRAVEFEFLNLLAGLLLIFFLHHWAFPQHHQPFFISDLFLF